MSRSAATSHLDQADVPEGDAVLSPAAPTAAPHQRLVSLDALRGFTMFWLVGGREFLLAATACLYPPLLDAVETQVTHPVWQGYVAWDVHHGNGTQDIFYTDDSVFYFSTHQSPWYPWTGRKDETGGGRGLGTTLNWPMAHGAGRKQFASAFDALASAANRFKPDLVLISAGFDARHGDSHGRLELTDEDFAELTGRVLDVARQNAGGRVVSVLEGGYTLTGLASAAAAHCGRLQQG
jgi:hypothetical protein